MPFLSGVASVDVVTERRHNLHTEWMALLGLSDPFLEPEPPPLYAVACRTARRGDARHLDTWSERLAVGAPLPTLPLWLADGPAVPRELEAAYEGTCRALRIP